MCVCVLLRCQEYIYIHVVFPRKYIMLARAYGSTSIREKGMRWVIRHAMAINFKVYARGI